MRLFCWLWTKASQNSTVSAQTCITITTSYVCANLRSKIFIQFWVKFVGMLFCVFIPVIKFQVGRSSHSQPLALHFVRCFLCGICNMSVRSMNICNRCVYLHMILSQHPKYTYEWDDAMLVKREFQRHGHRRRKKNTIADGLEGEINFIPSFSHMVRYVWFTLTKAMSLGATCFEGQHSYLANFKYENPQEATKWVRKFSEFN